MDVRMNRPSPILGRAGCAVGLWARLTRGQALCRAAERAARCAPGARNRSRANRQKL